MKILASAIFALSFCALAAEKYGVYDLQGNRVSTFEAEPHELPEKARQIKNSNPHKNLYVSSYKKGKGSKPGSRYKAETGAYIEASRNETFSICPEKKSQGTWISEHSVALDEKNCISVQAPDLAGTFRVLFMENSGLMDTIQVLVEQSYIQMGDYSHKMYVSDRNAIDSITRLEPHASWSNVLPGNYGSRSYSQPLIVDKTKFTMGDAHYYSENGDIPKRKRVYRADLYPKKIEESKLPYVEYMNWVFANERSKKEGLDTAYFRIDIRNNNMKGNKNLILLGDTSASDASYDFIAIDTSASGYRLPFEEEWFFLMRAGASTRYYWGDNEDSLTVSRYAWFRQVGLKPVAQLLPNRFGLYDMVGITDEQVMTHYSYVANGTYYDYHALASSFGSRCPECYFMRETGTVYQVMRILPRECVSRRNEKGEREDWTCTKVEQKPKLVNEKSSFNSFRLLRKTPKLHKLEKF